MKVAVDLVAETAVTVDDTTYFSLAVELNGRRLPGSEGTDRYRLNGMVLPGKRVAATGRRAEYGTSATPTGVGFGPLEAEPPVPCPLVMGRQDALAIVVENNAVLDPALFCLDFSFLVRMEDDATSRVVDIALRRPDVRMSWPSRGLFRFDVTPALSD
ncbi:MAG: hypothetical protein NUV93_04310 [Firmicutes bacterium]|nr:hypothetical protein [Bacillota bacterium]